MPAMELTAFTTFGDLLRYLRKRAQLTQRDLAIAVGYSEGHVSRLEKNQRVPDPATVAALFIPALGLEEEPVTVAHLLRLAGGKHVPPSSGMEELKISRTAETIQVSEGLESIPSNLPIQLTTFIGRRNEVAELVGILSGEKPSRLITLTGPGGMGKTRLALESAIQLLSYFPDGIWFVDLAPLSAPEFVPPAIASTLKIPILPGQEVEQTLLQNLRSKAMLIVLDNCEHLILSAGQIVQKLLSSCPHLQVLATSREALNLPGEINFHLPALSLPAEINATRQNLLGHESIQLFIERARQIDPSFAMTDANAPGLARICRRLDGMPLAIELAAARTSLLSLNQIEARLHDRFRLLTGGHATLPRHQTLRAVLEWSHDLLSEAEQRLFRRLSVFAGGWTLEAGESVCGEAHENSLDLIAQLVNKSLVAVERQPDSDVRYNMLETVREYADQQLLLSGEAKQIRSRHFDYYFQLAERAEGALFSSENSIDWAERELGNLRGALTWSLEKDSNGITSEERTGRALEMISDIWLLWHARGYSGEGSQWLDRLLSVHTAPTPARGRALLLAADLAGFRGDYPRKLAYVQESLFIAQQLGDRRRIAWSLMQTGLVERDLRHHSESIEFLLEGLAGFEALQDNLWISRTNFLLAETHLANRDVVTARPYLQRGLEVCRADHDKWQLGWGLELSGDLARLEGRLEQAGTSYRESLHLRLEVMDKAGILYALEAFAHLAVAEGQFERAALLWGATEILRQILNLVVDAIREDLRREPLRLTRTHLGEETFAAAQARGRALSMEEVVAYVMTPQQS